MGFLIFFVTMIWVISSCYKFLFGHFDEDAKTGGLSLFKILSYPIGSFSYKPRVERQGDPKGQHYFVIAKQVCDLMIIYFLMIIMINMLIALLSNMY